jgi:hypothetical protein
MIALQQTLFRVVQRRRPNATGGADIALLFLSFYRSLITFATDETAIAWKKTLARKPADEDCWLSLLLVALSRYSE